MSMGTDIDIFENISPLDFRYYGRSKEVFGKLVPYLSERAMVRCMARVESALTKVLADYKVCSKDVAEEVAKACRQIDADEVYKEEDRIKHNVRALVNCIRKRVSRKAKPYVHFTTTSHDIICTAEALRYRNVTNKVIIPALAELEKTLIALARREKSTLQIGRTHGQHAEPLTFGFALSEYVSRLGNCIMKIKGSADDLRGKIAGAVGAYNASSLFFSDPAEFEKKVLAELGLKPATHSTQIAEPEFITSLAHNIITAFGVIANLADDMRHLQRSEIAEVGEAFGKEQVGSSTMPHKRNPINFENVKSMWKEFMPRISTLYMDQLSEHQRDLTNSASSRFTTEIIAGFYASAIRLNRIMSRLVVDRKNLKKNFDKAKDMIVAEPLYILLAANGHPDSHEHVRKLTLESQRKRVPLQKVIFSDKSIGKYLKKFTKKQLEILRNPEKYVGISSQKASFVCDFWEKKMKLLGLIRK